jgi:hypothetical protein
MERAPHLFYLPLSKSICMDGDTPYPLCTWILEASALIESTSHKKDISTTINRRKFKMI